MSPHEPGAGEVEADGEAVTALELRADVPALQTGTYLNFGAHGPSPHYVVDAADEFVRSHEFEAPVESDPYGAAFEEFDRTRERLAAFVGAEPDEIGLTESTTAGINAVANAIEWEPGDVVVRTDLEHPAGRLPWQQLEREGVEVRVVETEAGRIDLDAFALVDAVQVPGQLPMDVGEWGADAVAAAGHKWLLGLWGGEFLYVDRDAASDLAPRTVGYRSVDAPDADPFEYAAGARRFEIGSANPAPHVALREAVDVIDELGVGEIRSRIRGLVERLLESVPPDRLHSPATPESGLVTIEVDDPAATVDRLTDEGVVIRSLSEPAAVRASIHAVNTAREVDRLAEGLAAEWG